MIERAEMKLRLDQVVIQQGRLAEAQKGLSTGCLRVSFFGRRLTHAAHASLLVRGCMCTAAASKEELLNMIQFGAQEILHTRDRGYVPIQTTST